MIVRTLIACGILWLSGAVGLAQEPFVTSFEEGKERPTGWKPLVAPGTWERTGRTGARSISMTGDGKTNGRWILTPLPLQPNRAYRFSVWYRSDQEQSGRCSLPIGLSFNVRTYRPSPEWTRVEFIFSTPDSLKGHHIRLGQSRLIGKAWFDDCRIEPVNLSYLSRDGFCLDQHERIENGTYVFEPDFRTGYTDCFRVDHGHTAIFHGNKWWILPGRHVTHRYRVGECKQISAQIQLHIHYEDPRREDTNVLTAEAGTDGKTWAELGRFDSKGTYDMTLPAKLFPADQIFVRMSCTGSMQISRYKYSAKLDGSPPNLKGTTDAFKGNYVTVDNGPLRLAFAEGDTPLVAIQRDGKLVGQLECRIAQFEKEGIGYKGTGIGVAEAGTIKHVEVKTNEPKRCAIHVTAARLESAPMARQFEATYELTIHAGQEWLETKLLSVKNTDRMPYELRGYFHRLQPAGGAKPKAWCYPAFAGWIWDSTILGATARGEDDFTLGLRLADDTPHGDITRKLATKLNPGDTWSEPQPAAIVFVARGAKPKALVHESGRVLKIATSPAEHATGAIVLQERKGEAGDGEAK